MVKRNMLCKKINYFQNPNLIIIAKLYQRIFKYQTPLTVV